MHRRHIGGAVVAVLAVSSSQSLAQSCPAPPPREACEGQAESLFERVQHDGVLQAIRTSEQRVRSEFGIPAPYGWSTDYGRMDITKFRSTDHDDNPSTPNETANVLIAEDIVEHLAANQRLAGQLDAQLSAIAAGGSRDPALALSLAYREASGALFSTSSSLYDTFAGGGFDNLGDVFDQAQAAAVCGSETWARLPQTENETGPVTPAEIPRNETLIAADAYLQVIQPIVLQELRRYGFDPGLISTPAKRVATAVAFANPTTSDQREYRGDGRETPGAKGFSIRTLVSWMRARIDAGLAEEFNDVVSDADLRQFARVRSAIAATAVAEMLDASLLAPNGGIPCPCAGLSEIDECVVGEWRQVENSLDQWLSENKPSKMTMNLSSNAVAAFRADGTYASSDPNRTLESTVIHSDGVTQADGQMSGGAAGRWSAQNGQLNICIDLAEMLGSLSVQSPTGRTIDVPISLPPGAGNSIMTMSYSCTAGRLETSMQVPGVPLVQTGYERLTGPEGHERSE